MIVQTWDLLAEAISEIEYKRDPLPQGYQRFRLNRSDAENFAMLNVFTYNLNTYQADSMRHTRHEFIVPVATYNKRQWRRWVIERVISIEVHETVENLFVNGERLYSPYHGNGWDPYAFWPEGDPLERAKAPGDD